MNFVFETSNPKHKNRKHVRQNRKKKARRVAGSGLGGGSRETNQKML